MSTPVRRGRTLRQRLIGYISDGTTRLRGAWSILTNAQNALLSALSRIRPGREGAGNRLNQAVAAFNQALSAFDRSAVGFVERWAARTLPLIYREGAWLMLERADRDTALFGWTDRHRDAITTTSAQYFADLMNRIREALRRARAFLRAATDAAREASRTGRFDADALRNDHPLGTVVYANNARHPVDSWAAGAITWQAVTTANTGAARTALDEIGTQFVEIRDGADCGWTSHDDDDKANRTVRTVQDALAHPVAHPNCQRELLPRLDIAGRTDIMSGALL